MVINSSKFNTKESIEWAVNKYLEEYQGDVIEVVTQTTKEVAREAVKKLKENSPKRKGPKGGKYAKGWTYKLEKGRLSAGATIYGKSGTYQLAHLLEHGHALRGGGRSGRVKEKVHIAPVEQWANDEIIDRTIRRLEGI